MEESVWNRRDNFRKWSDVTDILYSRLLIRWKSGDFKQFYRYLWSCLQPFRRPLCIISDWRMLTFLKVLVSFPAVLSRNMMDYRGESFHKVICTRWAFDAPPKMIRNAFDPFFWKYITEFPRQIYIMWNLFLQTFDFHFNLVSVLCIQRRKIKRV